LRPVCTTRVAAKCHTTARLGSYGGSRCSLAEIRSTSCRWSSTSWRVVRTRCSKRSTEIRRSRSWTRCMTEWIEEPRTRERGGTRLGRRVGVLTGPPHVPATWRDEPSRGVQSWLDHPVDRGSDHRLDHRRSPRRPSSSCPDSIRVTRSPTSQGRLADDPLTQATESGGVHSGDSCPDRGYGHSPGTPQR